MFVPGVNGSIISNAPSGSKLKGAFKNSKKRKMPNGGTLPPRYTSNPNDPRIGRYRDSLNLYKKGESDYASYLKTNKRLNIPSTSTLIQNNPYVYDGDTPAKIQPIISHRYWYNHNPDVISGTNIPSKTIKEWTDRYKKPVQPYIYKKPTASTRSILTKVSKPYVYKKPEVVPEVVKTPVAPIEQPVKKIGYTKPIIQQFNYMSNENKAKALKKYGSVSDIPYQGVNINELKDGGRLNKYQTGGLGNFKPTPQKSLLPSWLKVQSATPYQLNDLSPNSKMVGNLNDYSVGDISEDKNALFNNSSIKLATQKRLKGNMGRLDIDTTLTPFKDKKFTSPNITYSNSIGNSKRSADLRVTPENQSLSLSNNSLINGNVNLNRNMTPNGLINSLDANLQIPYTGVTVGRSVTTRPGESPMSEELRAGYSGKKVNLNAYSKRDGADQTYGSNLKTNLGPVNLSGNVNYNTKNMQDYNIAANVDLLNPTKLNPNRGNLNLSGSYGASRNNEGGMNPNYRIGLNYTNSFKEGGETDPVMEGERMQELPIHKKLSWSEKLRRNINRFEKKIGLGSAKKVNDVTEGSTSWTPTVPKPYMRTMQEPPGGYRDNMKVVTPDSFIDSANRARIDAQQAEEARRKRSGVISQGTPKSAYEKAREASSFVSQAKRRKGSADPLDYVLDMINPAAIGFAGVDLVDNTGSAVSNVAQGNLKEAGSDLLNAGLNTLQIIPATRGLRGPLKSASKYLTTNTALKNTYKYNPLAFKPNSEAYYRVMPEAGAKDLINSGFVRPAEGSPTSYFNKGVPLDIRRARTFGNDTREAYHGYKGPYMVESNNPNAFDPWLQFPEPSLKFYQTKAPIPASDIKLYKEDWLKGYKQIKKPGLKKGGEIDHDDDKDMVNGVASILRRVKDPKNRLQLANQLSKQFDREKVKYDLPSFLNKSKVKK